MMPPTSHNSTTLVLRRVFTAPRERVFRAWTEPEAVQRWFRPRGMSVTVRSLDAQVGGSFCFELEDGSSIIGTYLHIVFPEQLVFTWSGQAIEHKETIVTLDFLNKGSTTEIVLTHERLDTPHLREMFESGWSSQFDELATLLNLYHSN